MNARPSRLFAPIIALMAISLMAAQAGPSHHLLNEDAALNQLLRALEHDQVYAHRISLDCVTFGTEETTRTYFQFVLRENHTPKCGGDPDISPVVDRYRVYRISRKIERLNAVDDTWQPYNPAKVR